MTDALTYAAMLALGEDALADTFPHGANATNNRWTPAAEGEEPSLTRDNLLRRRRDLQERARFMPTDPTRPPLKPFIHSASHKGVLGAATHTSETDMGETQEPEPEMVDDETQRRITEEAHIVDDLRKQQVPLSKRLAALEGRLRPEQLASVRKRIEGLERSAHEKAA